MEQAKDDDVRGFARTFAPDEHRAPYRRPQWMWLGVGVVFVIGGMTVLVVAWLAQRGTIPASMLRTAAEESSAAARARNRQAAPYAALSALPLLVAGGWNLARQPPNRTARLIAAVGAAAFLAAGILTDALVG